MENGIARDRRTVPAFRRGGNNRAALAGRLEGEFVFSRRGRSENYYLNSICVFRSTGMEYTIPIMVPQSVIPLRGSNVGRCVEIRGEFRSYNYRDEQREHTAMLVYALKLETLPRFQTLPGLDEIFLDGFVCKEPVTRCTRGGRPITCVILAVNRSYERTDYIPCIFRDRMAGTAAQFRPGMHLAVWGEIQSRVYEKRLPGQGSELRTAYEVSVQRMEER